MLRLREVVNDGAAVTKAPEMAKAPALSEMLGLGIESGRER
ncbi:MAG: hypothetical protein A4E72_01883 [Syntrophus sp. PtaU1.Bin208]|nr:MAG: hypothetical protein A4E72_01883 [Syntrophus sp. PtaU1.Bin208]